MLSTTLFGFSLLINVVLIIHFKNRKTPTPKIVVVEKPPIKSDSFTERLLHQYPDLTPREVELALQVRNGMNNGELEEHLCISYSSVLKAKYRLRSKLKTDNTKLEVFLRRL